MSFIPLFLIPLLFWYLFTKVTWTINKLKKLSSYFWQIQRAYPKTIFLYANSIFEVSEVFESASQTTLHIKHLTK